MVCGVACAGCVNGVVWRAACGGQGVGPLALWWEALLLFVPLATLGLLLLPLTPSQRRLQLGHVAVFAVANCVVFQPAEIDNTKVEQAVTRAFRSELRCRPLSAWSLRWKVDRGGVTPPLGPPRCSCC